MRGTIRLLVIAVFVLLLALGSTLLPSDRASAGSAPTVVFVDSTHGQWRMDGIGSFYYGIGGDRPLLCDWNGDGIDTVAVYRSSSGEMHLRNSNTQGVSNSSFYYGSPGDLPVCGDWNGDGTDTIGVYRPSSAKFHLRNSNTQGPADITFQLAPTGGRPFAGDFNGNGIDTVGLWDGSTGTFQTSDRNTGAVKRRGQLGGSGDQIVIGDWDNDGRDTIGVYDRGSGNLRVSAVGDGAADVQLGARTGTALAGNIGNRQQVELYEASRGAPSPTATTTTRPVTTTTTRPAATTTTTVAAPPPPQQWSGSPSDVWGLFVYNLENKLSDDSNMRGVLNQYDAILTQWSPRTFNERMQWASDNGIKVMYQAAGSGWFREPAGWKNGPGGSRLNLSKWREGVVDRYVNAGVDFDYWTQEGTLLGIYMMDEPMAENSWGAAIPAKTLDVDMAGYLNGFFPKTRTYVRAAPSILPNRQYQYLDGGWSQWTWVKGFSWSPKKYRGVDWWVSNELAAANARGFNRNNLVWGMAAQHGGQPNDQSGWGLPTYGPSQSGSGQGGTYMRPEEILQVAQAIQSAPGIGAFVFRYDTTDWFNRLPNNFENQWHNALTTAANNAN